MSWYTFNDLIYPASGKMRESQLKSLLRMTGVTDLVISGYHGFEAESSVLLRGLCAKLEKLSCTKMPAVAGLVFPELRDLRCDLMTEDSGDFSCPRLLSLKVLRCESFQMLANVSPDHMQELVMHLNNTTNLDLLVNPIIRFKKLRILLISMYLCNNPDVSNTSSLLRLFHAFTRLTNACIRAYDFTVEGDGDAAVTALTSTNPELRSLTVYGLQMSDASLDAVIPTKHITFLRLKSKDSCFTTAGVLFLLRSRLRHQLLELDLKGQSGLDVQALEKELASMDQETGCNVRRTRREQVSECKVRFVFDS